MPRPKSVSCLQDLSAEAVAANLADVSWARLIFVTGDSQVSKNNPFETLRNLLLHNFIKSTAHLMLHFVFHLTASSILTAIMDAVLKKHPTMIHLLKPLITNTLETLKLNHLWSNNSSESCKLIEYSEAATGLLFLSAVQQSVGEAK